MATRTTSFTGRPFFIEDDSSIERGGGRQIDWANVSNTYLNAATGKKELPAGTAMGTLLGGGRGSPRVVTTNPATYILATNAVEDSESAALSGYGELLGGVIYENLLPQASGSPKVLLAAIKTELAAAGCTFKYRQYGDSTTAS